MVNETTTRNTKGNEMANQIIATRKVKIRSAAASYHYTTNNEVIRLEDGQTESKPVPEMSWMTKKEFMHSASEKVMFEVEKWFAREAAADPNSNVRAYYSF